MNRNIFCLSLFAVGMMAMPASGCSETGQFMEDGLPASVTNEAEPGESAPVALTKSEAVALAVQQKGTCKITEDEALQNLNRFHVSSFDSEETGISVTDVVLKTNPDTGKCV
ncbi:MAG: hypothetical protein LBF62_13015 [Tannerellaceae bacterium]|jgi:hypothetical protein|nr:hypothetical protein [Tannerellaceae bacterium]